MSTLTTEMALAEARDAARAGDLAGAREHLDGLDSADPEVLDLRARVLAQDGDLDGAEQAWRALDAARPGDPAAAAGLAAVADLRSGRRRRRRVVVVAGVVVLLGAVAVGGTLAAGGPSAPEAPVAAAPGTPVTPAPVPAAVPDPAPALADALARPGLTARARDGVVEVTFDEGLFAGGTTLTTGGRRLLADLGPRLVGQVREVEVVGRSVAVAGGPSSGGSTVALARAQSVAAALAEDGPPLTTFDLAAAEQTRTSGDDAARSRTVELRLTP
ncbi:hypothetical protein [Actinomycetospora aeridis]|uniref:OmpA family protein n=1 Tax=Actinomycetospora aeridis TaxID=3129231 RepID=A0ABU8MZA6_9PSEU